METFREEIRGKLPAHLEHLLYAQWIPLPLVRSRHSELHLDPLIALFCAYEHIGNKLPVKELINKEILEDSGGCQRCGSCCIYMRPGTISAMTFRKWSANKCIISDFFRTMDKGEYPSYSCWFFNDVKLRMCPILLWNVQDSKTFCSIHHMGPDNRHPACSGFRANPPLCDASARSLEW